jgi:putative transposase
VGFLIQEILHLHPLHQVQGVERHILQPDDPLPVQLPPVDPPSLSHPGDVLDDEQFLRRDVLVPDVAVAVAESFFSSLKKERIRRRIYRSREEARADVFDYIEVFYNRVHRHSHIGQMSPRDFERAVSNQA